MVWVGKNYVRGFYGKHITGVTMPKQIGHKVMEWSSIVHILGKICLQKAS